MGVLFDNIPQNIRVPFFYGEFRSGGTPSISPARLLLVGQKLTAGDATANAPVLVTDGAIDALFGAGSMLSAMCRTARLNAPAQEIWALPLDDNGAGVAATGKIVVADIDDITQAVQMTVYVAGERIRIPVLGTDTDTTVATALAAAINALTYLPVTAAVTGANSDEVTITARHKGLTGNSVMIDLGTISEDGVVGLTHLTITAMASGAGDPDLTAAFNALGDQEYDWIAGPYADAAALSDVSDLLNDINGRWAWNKQLYGHYTGTHVGTVGDLSTLGNGRNDAHASIFPCRKFRSPSWQVAAAVGARAARHLQAPGSSAELSRPLQTLMLMGIKGPLLQGDILKLSEKQTLLYDGISTYFVDRAGNVCIERLVTTYQTNAWGDGDATYLDVNTMAQSMYGIRHLRAKLTSTHGRKALANDNPSRNPGIVTVKDIRDTIVHGYQELVDLGVFEGLEMFARDLVVERDQLDVNRINASLPLDHVNQLRILAVAAVNHMQRQAA